mmetsp:Transcript_10628/g.28928  ORF Transcript_10628/g.28928 Transcript_10628/m.28928 type:complete len:217 (-) Transcript_10628:269-919(-)
MPPSRNFYSSPTWVRGRTVARSARAVAAIWPPSTAPPRMRRRRQSFRPARARGLACPTRPQKARTPGSTAALSTMSTGRAASPINRAATRTALASTRATPVVGRTVTATSGREPIQWAPSAASPVRRRVQTITITGKHSARNAATSTTARRRRNAMGGAVVRGASAAARTRTRTATRTATRTRTRTTTAARGTECPSALPTAARAGRRTSAATTGP